MLAPSAPTLPQIRVYQPDAVILAQGAAADCLYIVLSGGCSAHRLVEISGARRVPVDANAWEVVERTEQRSIALGRLKRFDVFGEDAVVAEVRWDNRQGGRQPHNGTMLMGLNVLFCVLARTLVTFLCNTFHVTL